MDAVYFTKVEYREYLGCGLRSILLLDLPEKTISYQVCERVFDTSPAITGIRFRELFGHIFEEEVRKPAVVMRNGKTAFKPRLIEKEGTDMKITFSHGIRLTDEDLGALLPLCNAKDFEPYRGKKMSMDDEGYCGYRDEVDVVFTGITDSYIPKLELPMDYFYDEEHIWPSERLYRFLITHFFGEKKFRAWVTGYGGLSLFY